MKSHEYMDARRLVAEHCPKVTTSEVVLGASNTIATDQDSRDAVMMAS